MAHNVIPRIRCAGVTHRHLFLLALAMTSCSKDESRPTEDAAAPLQTTFGGARPVDIRVPAGYDASRPAPLLLALHGYGSSGRFNDITMKLTTIADAKGFIYVAPDGTRDSKDLLFWNATDECCDYDKSGVDDVGYLTSLVDEIRTVYAIDTKRVFVVGHSNGAFMANRLACDRADVFAAIVSWAGAPFADASRCRPSTSVGYLQLHGTKDMEVPFDAVATQVTGIWAEKNSCAASLDPTGTVLRVDADSTAPDTKIARHGGCTGNGAAELWPVDGAGHVFTLTPEALEALWTFLDGHAKR